LYNPGGTQNAVQSYQVMWAAFKPPNSTSNVNGMLSVTMAAPSITGDTNDLGRKLAITSLGNGSFAIGGYGIPGNIYKIQYTANLPMANWLDLGTATADPSGAFILVDTNLSRLRFYRAAFP
jgi:hypothetical protein